VKGERETVRGVEHTRAKGREKRKCSSGLSFQPALSNESEGVQKASMGGRREEGNRKEREEGRESNIRIQKSAILVGYKTKDIDPLLPVRSLAKEKSGQ